MPNGEAVMVEVKGTPFQTDIIGQNKTPGKSASELLTFCVYPVKIDTIACYSAKVEQVIFK